MEERLRERVVGQDHALELISESVRRARARPLKRAIQRRLENKLAEGILSGMLLPGDTAVFDFGEDGWKLEPRRAREPVEAAAAR